MRPWLKAGLGAGVAFSIVGVTFVAVSLFTDISRSTWVALDIVKAVICFAFCGLGGLVAVRHTHRVSSGVAAGALGGAMAGAIVPVSMYLLAYGFLDVVRQYPYEYYDYLQSGASSMQAYLRSPKGHADVVSTSVGLVPLAMLFTTAVGAAMGFLGGTLGKRFLGASPATSRPNTPLQPTSGANKSQLTRRIVSAARG